MTPPDLRPCRPADRLRESLLFTCACGVRQVWRWPLRFALPAPPTCPECGSALRSGEQPLSRAESLA